jgi:glycosyltransferase involved in cell wall biosynthesis
MSDVTLSVVIPTYNRRDLLGRCLDALEACHFPGLEAVVVDDGSTEDVTPALDGRRFSLTYLRQPNRGVSAARNAGFAHTRGRYVAFLDHDDWWHPSFPARALDVLERHPDIDFLFTNVDVGNEETGYEPGMRRAPKGSVPLVDLPHRGPEPGLRVFEPWPLFRNMLWWNCVYMAGHAMRRGACERAGGFDESNRSGAEDRELWQRMLAGGAAFAFLDERLAVYYRRPGSLSTDPAGMAEGVRRALQAVLGLPGLAQPDRDLVRGSLRDHDFTQAYAAYDRGDLPTARRWFRRLAADAGLTPWTAALLGASHLPGPVTRGLRRVKQLVAG